MKRKELPERERLTAGYLKSFFDRIAPSVIRFYPDSFVCGNSWRCVWAIREYPPMTEEQALLSHIGDRAGVTLHVYTRIVDGAEQRQILLNATRKNRMLSGSENLQEAATGVGNLTDIERLLEDLRREREPLLHCAVFLELSADTQESLNLFFHTEGQEAGIGQVGVPVEKPAFVPNAHGMQPQTDLAEQFPCEQRRFPVLRLLVFFLRETVEVREDWVIGRAEVGEICRAPDSEILIQLGQQNADCVQLRIGEVFICPKEIPQETDMLV